jgi:cytochrome c
MEQTPEIRSQELPMKKTLSPLLILYGVLCLFFAAVFAAEAPQSKEAKQIVALVDKAAALTESKGKTAFPEFKKKGSEWLKGETYIFIADMNGTILMHPANPELETKNILDLKDANGKAFMREFIETAKKGSGWVEYMWPKPGEKKPSKKLAYIKPAKIPSGETILVGAGIYTN